MPFSGPYPDLVIPECSVYDLLFASLEGSDEGRTAFIDATSGDRTTYGRLREQVDELAMLLARNGIRPGDVVGLLSPNSPRFGVGFHAILRAGAVATTLNAICTAGDGAAQLTDAKASALLTAEATAETARAAAASAGIPPHRVFVLDGADSVMERARTERDAVEDLPTVTAGDLAVLPYSSGTTGRPKGVMLTHGNLVANVCQVEPLFPVAREDVVSAILPFSHIYGMTMLLNVSLRARAALVTLPRFEIQAFLGSIETHRCSLLLVAPPVAVMLAKGSAVEEYDLTSVHTVFSGAAPLDRALAGVVAERLACRIRQGYGMSEMAPVSHLVPFERDDVDPSSVGFTVPNMTCKLVDIETGEEIRVPEEGSSPPGELWCAGPNVMSGYLGNEEATRQTIDAEGFLHTGDIATVDARGVVTIVDRLKELIKYKGYQVPPAELEALLLTHDGVADAAVVGVRDAEGEEVPKAFVVRQPDADVDADDIMGFVAARVSPHKKVRAVEFVAAIPKSPSGKILRRELRATGAATTRSS